MSSSIAGNIDDTNNLVQLEAGSHGGLDVDGLHVLPVLLEKRDKEVDGDGGVLTNLILTHLDVADSATEAKDLLELELDGGLDLGDLLNQVVSHGDGGGELTGTVHVGANDLGDGTDDGLGGQEEIVASAELLHELLVLVQLLQVVHGLGGETGLLGDILLLQITDDASGQAGASNVGELDAAGETLITADVVVLQVDLDVNRLHELARLLVLGVIKDTLDGVGDGLGRDLGHCWARVRRSLEVLLQ